MHNALQRRWLSMAVGQTEPRCDGFLGRRRVGALIRLALGYGCLWLLAKQNRGAMDS